MNVLVCGFHWSGSSALVDMLHAFYRGHRVRYEFDEFRRIGGILDHAEGLSPMIYKSSLESYANAYMKHFTINGDQYMKRRSEIMIDAQNKFKNIEKKEDKSSVRTQIATEFIADLKKIHTQKKSDFLILDQPLIPGSHCHVWPEVLSPFFLFYVYRDPRDQMHEIIKKGHLAIEETSISSMEYGRGRDNLIKYNLAAIERRFHWAIKIKKRFKGNVFIIRFEDLLENPDFYLEHISKIINQKYRKSLSKLNPSISINNTNRYLESLSQEEADFTSSYLNKTLSEMDKLRVIPTNE